MAKLYKLTTKNAKDHEIVFAVSMTQVKAWLLESLAVEIVSATPVDVYQHHAAKRDVVDLVNVDEEPVGEPLQPVNKVA